MVEVRVGRWAGNAFEYDVKDIDHASLGPKSDDAHGLLSLVPRPEIQKAVGKSHGALINALKKVGAEGAGLKLPKRALPAEDREFGGGPNVIYYSPEHAQAVVDHYKFQENLDKTHRKMTAAEAKNYFKSTTVSKLNKMLEGYGGEKDSKLEKLSLEVTRKTVLGQKLILFKTQTSSYYYPRTLIDDPQAMEKWAAELEYDVAKRELPQGCNDHGIVVHMNRQAGVSYKRIRRWLEENDAGVTVNTATGEVGPLGDETKGNRMLVKPEKVRAFEVYLEGHGSKEGFTPSSSFAKSLGINQPQMMSWLRRSVRGRYGQEIEAFGMPCHIDGEQIYVQATLADDEADYIRNAGKGKGLEELEKGLSAKLALEGKRRHPYHPELQRLIDEGNDLQACMEHNEDLERWGVKVEEIPQRKSPASAPSYRAVQTNV